jgi:hypothetical protein
MSDSERLTFEAEIKPDGRFSPRDAMATRARLAKWKGRKVLVTVSRYVKSKTLPQLGYYFGVILPFWAESAGYTEKELDDDLRTAFLPRVLKVSKFTGEEVMEQVQLRDLNCEQASAYIDAVLRQAAAMGEHIPAPNERWEPQEWSA